MTKRDTNDAKHEYLNRVIDLLEEPNDELTNKRPQPPYGGEAYVGP